MSKLVSEVTATAYIVEHHQNQPKTLLIYHPKFGKWMPPGGHVELGEAPHEAACREALEETGLEVELIKDDHISIELWNGRSIPRPFACMQFIVPARRGEPSHQHLDFTYIACPKRSVSSAAHPVRWFTLEEIRELKSDEEVFGDSKIILEKIFSLPINFVPSYPC